MVADTDPPPRRDSLSLFNQAVRRDSLLVIFNDKLASACRKVGVDAARLTISPAVFSQNSEYKYFLFSYHSRLGPGMPWDIIFSKWGEEYVQLLFFADQLENTLINAIREFIDAYVSEEPVSRAVYTGNVTQTAMQNYVLRKNSK